MSLGSPPFQRIRNRAGQVPHNTRGSEIKLHVTVEGPVHHRVDDRAAEASPLRRRHGRSVALSPAHRKDIAVKTPTYVDTARVHRKRAVLAGIGGKLVQ